MREIGEQLYDTTVLYNRLCPEFKPLCQNRLQQKCEGKNMLKMGKKQSKKWSKSLDVYL
jgi:hypothetical protein